MNEDRRTLEARRVDDLRRLVDENVAERLNALEQALERQTENLHAAVREAISQMPRLSAEEHRWVQLAIKHESQTIEFRKAVIEKTLTSLIWAGVVGLGILVKEWLASKGLKL